MGAPLSILQSMYNDSPAITISLIVLLIGSLLYYFGLLYSQEHRRNRLDKRVQGLITTYNIFLPLVLFVCFYLAFGLIKAILFYILLLSLNTVISSRKRFIEQFWVLLLSIVLIAIASTLTHILPFELVVLFSAVLFSEMCTNLTRDAKSRYYTPNFLYGKITDELKLVIKGREVALYPPERKELLLIKITFVVLVISTITYVKTLPIGVVSWLYIFLLISNIIALEGLEYDPGEHPLCEVILKSGKKLNNVFFMREEGAHFVLFIDKKGNGHLINKNEIVSISVPCAINEKLSKNLGLRKEKRSSTPLSRVYHRRRITKRKEVE